MASIVSTGIGSGLDVAGIVQQLVAAEGQPVSARIGQQEAKAQAKLSAFGSLKAALSDLRDRLDDMRDLQSLLKRSAVSGNEDLFTVSAGEAAYPASYSVEVVNLAAAQKLTSGAFADADAEVGTGTLTVALADSSVDIEITSENNTLSAIRDAINSAPDNPGVAASIVNADSGSYLILTGEDTGAANTITVTQAGGDGGLAALEYDPDNGLTSLTESIAAQDALIRIDGLDVISAGNTISEAIEGVTISLLQADPGETNSLQVENDEDAVRKSVQGFVVSYNALVDTFARLTEYDAEGNIAAPLLGDATVRAIRDVLRRELSEVVTGTEGQFDSLRQVGIDIQLDGKLEIVEDDFSAVLADDFTQFGQLFASEDGLAVRLFDLAEGYLDTDGIIETRTRGLNEDIDQLSEDRDALTSRLISLEERLLRQFNALDSLLAELSSTSIFLTQQLDNLPGFVRQDQNS